MQVGAPKTSPMVLSISLISPLVWIRLINDLPNEFIVRLESFQTGNSEMIVSNCSSRFKLISQSHMVVISSEILSVRIAMTCGSLLQVQVV